MSPRPLRAPAVNEALRRHVTRVGFDLTLGKTHIAVLVLIKEGWQQDRVHSTYGSPWNQFCTAGTGLILRGLVWHEAPEREHKKKPSQIWGLTSAGEHVVALLIESGIYQEFLAELPAATRAEYVA